MFQPKSSIFKATHTANPPRTARSQFQNIPDVRASHCWVSLTVGVCLGPQKSRTCRPFGQFPLVLPVGLARGQSKPQLWKARTAFPSALIRLSCNHSHKKAVLAFPGLAKCCARHIKDCPR